MSHLRQPVSTLISWDFNLGRIWGIFKFLTWEPESLMVEGLGCCSELVCTWTQPVLVFYSSVYSVGRTSNALWFGCLGFSYLTRASFKKLFYHRIVLLPPGNGNYLRLLKLDTRNQQWIWAILYDFLHRNACILVVVLRAIAVLMWHINTASCVTFCFVCLYLIVKHISTDVISVFLIPTSFFASWG